MEIDIQTAYAEACQALGEATVMGRLMQKQLAEQAAARGTDPEASTEARRHD